MRKNDLPWWETLLIGFEGDEDTGDDDGDEDADEDADEDEDHEDDEEEEEEDPAAGLKSALRKERQERRAAEKKLKALERQKGKTDQQEASELDKAKQEKAEADEKSAKLAQRLLGQEVEKAIVTAARAAGFKDPDDAVHLVNRKDLDIDQDDDDPTDIDIDEKSVKDAVKALAKKKPHLIKPKDDYDEDEDTPSRRTGSSFGGGRKNRQTVDEERLRDTYPALRNG